jgi:hypothetical protein
MEIGTEVDLRQAEPNEGSQSLITQKATWGQRRRRISVRHFLSGRTVTHRLPLVSLVHGVRPLELKRRAASCACEHEYA